MNLVKDRVSAHEDREDCLAHLRADLIPASLMGQQTPSPRDEPTLMCPLFPSPLLGKTLNKKPLCVERPPKNSDSTLCLVLSHCSMKTEDTEKLQKVCKEKERQAERRIKASLRTTLPPVSSN